MKKLKKARRVPRKRAPLNAYRIEHEEHKGAPFETLVIWDREPTKDDVARFLDQQPKLSLGELLAGPAPDGTFVYAAVPRPRVVHEVIDNGPIPPGRYTAKVASVTLDLKGRPVVRFTVNPKG